jgi:hypothetical protein
MDEQETPLAATTTPEEEITTTPLETTSSDIPLAGEPDVPPPAQQKSENEGTPQRDDPMQLDEDSIAVAHPQRDTSGDAPEVSQPEPDQLSIATPQPANVSTPTRGGSASARGSRGNKRVSFPIVGADTPAAMTDATPTSDPEAAEHAVPREELHEAIVEEAVAVSESVRTMRTMVATLQTAKPMLPQPQSQAAMCKSQQPSYRHHNPHRLPCLHTRRNEPIVEIPRAQSARSACEA